jgi:diguanylate cyclase (GGDEF)-like protein
VLLLDADTSWVGTLGGPRRSSTDRAGRDLLAPGAIRAVVQPIVRLADGEVAGYEALARADGASQPEPPDAWFARATVEGWSAQLEAACLRAVVALGPPPDDRLLFVNVLPRHLVAPEVLAVRELLPERLVVELTEQEAIADVGSVRAALARWTGRGAHLALDDVGSGYSGLQQVVHLQPEFLKLDRSLIRGIHDDRVRQAMVGALVGFAGQVGTTIIAEGVEHHDELVWLRDAGVPLAQGHHLARPGEPWPTPAPHLVAASWGDDTADVVGRLEEVRTVDEACALVVDELFGLAGVMPSVYLESAGRLRCRAQRGVWQVLDGMRTDAGVTGRCFSTGRAVQVPRGSVDVSHRRSIPGLVAEYCTPVRAGGRCVGVLDVEVAGEVGPRLRGRIDRLAAALGRRLERLPGEPIVPVRRLGRIVWGTFGPGAAGTSARSVIGAGCELVGTDSGAVVRTDTGLPRVAEAVGPLAEALHALEAAHLADIDALLETVTSCYSSGDATAVAAGAGDLLRRAGACSVVLVPLGVGDDRLGMLVLAHSAPLALGPDVIEPVELLAAIAGSHLRNAEHVRAVEKAARIDALTGLPNHAGFHEALRAAATAGPFAVAMFDVDRFKQVNDTKGHLFGDRLLASVADAMAACLPDGCHLYRVGGDEFAALLPTPGARGHRPDRGEAGIRAVLDAARATLRPYDASMSVGLAWQDGAEEPIETYRRADEALYVAKGSGTGLHRADAADRPDPPALRVL